MPVGLAWQIDAANEVFEEATVNIIGASYRLLKQDLSVLCIDTKSETFSTLGIDDERP